MLNKEDVNLMQRVSLKMDKKIIESVKNSEICSQLENISRNDIQTLMAIGSNQDMTMSDIAENMAVTLSTSTNAIDRLIKKSYVKRSVSEEDRRQVIINLSSKGKKLYEELVKLALEYMVSMTNCLTEREIDMLRTIFRKLDQNL